MVAKTMGKGAAGALWNFLRNILRSSILALCGHVLTLVSPWAIAAECSVMPYANQCQQSNYFPKPSGWGSYSTSTCQPTSPSQLQGSYSPEYFSTSSVWPSTEPSAPNYSYGIGRSKEEACAIYAANRGSSAWYLCGTGNNKCCVPGNVENFYSNAYARCPAGYKPNMAYYGAGHPSNTGTCTRNAIYPTYFTTCRLPYYGPPQPNSYPNVCTKYTQPQYIALIRKPSDGICTQRRLLDGTYQQDSLDPDCAAVTQCTYADKNLGAPERCTDDGLYQGNPTHAGTGNKYQAEVDYQSSGSFPLKLVRHYNSQANRPGRAGYNWNLFPSLTIISGTAVQATRADMKGLQFSFLNSQWQPDADVDEQLARLTDGSGNTVGWELTLADGVVETYTASGTITGYRHPSGQVITVSGADSTHAVLADANGRSLTLDFDAQNNLASLIDPAGGVTTYAYDAAGNLASVTYPGGQSKTYHYENPGFPHALTGITDENGDRYATWTYDAQGRAVSSEHAGGAERVDLTFNPDGSTTVTDALGAARTYGMTAVLGVVKSTGQSQPGGAGCGPASSTLAYDANGNVASRTDFNGNTTTYTYDLTRNLETSRTEAAGTAQARTIVTEWHASFRLPTKVTEPGLETTFTYDAKGNVTAKTLRDTVTNATRTWA